MKGKPLGIKLIAGMYIFYAVYLSIKDVAVSREYVSVIWAIVAFTIGCNFFKGNDFYRQVAIFFAYFSIVLLVSGMIAQPFILNHFDEYAKNNTRVANLIADLNETFALNISMLIFLSWHIFIIYYLKKPYVRAHFTAPPSPD